MNANATTATPTKLRLLFVEDSPEDAELCLRVLRRGGFDVEADVVQTEDDFQHRLAQESRGLGTATQVGSGQAGRPYDLVISDNALPRWSGSGVVDALQRTRPDLPLILVTGSIGEEAAVGIIKRGAFDYVLKDRMTRLPEAVRNALEHRALQAERGRAQEALLSSERRLRAVIDHEPECVKLVDAECRLIEMNAAGLRMIEAENLGEVLGRSVLPLVDENERGKFAELVRAAAAGKHGHLEFSIAGLRGTRRRLETRVAPLEVEGRRAVLAIARDLTEQRMLERKIQQLGKFEAIGQLAGGIAHDFNNILGAIMGRAELGLDACASKSPLQDTSGAQEAFRQIYDQAQRAAALTRQLLAFARRQILEPRNLDLDRVVADVAMLLRNLIGERIELKVAQDPRAPDEPVLARADPAQVEQVLMNLVVNARDAMPDGGTVTISTMQVTIDESYLPLHPYARPGRYVRLTVADTGIGMDAKTMEHIFEPFFTTKAPSQGTGLGLATVYGIIHQHGGFVNVYSEPGHGSEFHVYWPAAEGPAEQPEAAPARSVRGGQETILLAEDHEGLRATAQATLEMLGYKLLVARDGDEAKALLQKHGSTIDLMLLDVVMPKTNGPQVYEFARKVHPGLPALFSTGYGAESALLKDLLEKEAVAILQKPYSLHVLGVKIREILDRHPAGK